MRIRYASRIDIRDVSIGNGNSQRFFSATDQDLSSLNGWYVLQTLTDGRVVLMVDDAGTRTFWVVPRNGGDHAVAVDEILENRLPGSAFAFSPDFTRALYVRAGDLSDANLVLMDITTGKEIWQRDNYRYAPISQVWSTTSIAWSPDSLAVAVVINDSTEPTSQASSLYILGRDGVLSRRLMDGTSSSGGYGLAWSPDSASIALARNVSPLGEIGSSLSVFVYNRSTYKQTMFCDYAGIDTAVHNLNDQRLIWSPDSKYIAFGLGHDLTRDDNTIVALNLQTGAMLELFIGAQFKLQDWIPLVPDGNWVP